MIHNSFIFLERIGRKTEHNIWSQGISDWNAFLSAKNLKGFSKIRKNYYDKQLRNAKKALIDYDSAYFTSFPQSEAWRLYDYFRDDCLFLDIETSGYYGDITVLGMYDGDRTYTLIKDRSLTKYNLKQVLANRKLLVTFNGASFDLPVINRYFRNILPNIPHLDLRFPLAKLGFTGGLKKIEQELNIKRCEESMGLCGEDAIYLWHDYISTGNTKSLNLLVKYNEEDIINLRPLADFVFKNLSSKIKKSFNS